MKTFPHMLWIDRGIRASAAVALLIVLLCIASNFLGFIYQRPPGATLSTRGGALRVHFLAGSLIIANGDLPGGRAANVGMTLGYMRKPGLTWFWESPPKAWD